MKKDTILKHRQQIHYIQSKSSCRISLFTLPSDCSFSSQVHHYIHTSTNIKFILFWFARPTFFSNGHVRIPYQVEEVFRSKPRQNRYQCHDPFSIHVFLTITANLASLHHRIVHEFICEMPSRLHQQA